MVAFEVRSFDGTGEGCDAGLSSVIRFFFVSYRREIEGVWLR